MTRPAHRAPGDAVALVAVRHALTGLATIIIAAIVALVGFVVVAEHRRPQPAGSAATLTAASVFPGTRVVVAGGGGPYRIGVVRSEPACTPATTGDLGRVLAGHGCKRVVRALLDTPYDGYRATAGIFELAPGAEPAAVDAEIQETVEAGRGSFAALGAPTAQVNWSVHGRFLLYCAISRPDGVVIADDDANAARIAAELVNDYLPGRI